MGKQAKAKSEGVYKSRSNGMSAQGRGSRRRMKKESDSWHPEAMKFPLDGGDSYEEPELSAEERRLVEEISSRR